MMMMMMMMMMMIMIMMMHEEALEEEYGPESKRRKPGPWAGEANDTRLCGRLF